MVRTSSRSRLFAIVLTCASLSATGAAALGVVTATAASASDSSMFAQVNNSRASHGQSAYAWNSHLAEVAAEQAHRMANKNTLYHNPNLASDVGGYRWVGENVGYGPSSDVIEKAFMNSPHHRDNILDGNYTQIGIASVRDSGGRLWVAQVFREPMGSSSGSSSKKSTSTTVKAKKPTVVHRTHAVTHHADATQAKSTPKAKHTPKPTPTAANTPAPTPTLEQRVSYATAQDDSAGDPLADTLAFAATMNAVGG